MSDWWPNTEEANAMLAEEHKALRDNPGNAESPYAMVPFHATSEDQ